MVARGENPEVVLANGHIPPLFVQSLPAALQLPLYRIEDGRNAAYASWEASLKNLCFHLRINYDLVGMGPPAIDAFLPPFTRSKDEGIRQHALRLHEWQVQNTQLFMHIRSSVDLSGPVQSLHQRDVDASGALSD